MENKFANPKRLNMTEVNKEKICNYLKNVWMDSDTVAAKIGFSYVRAYSLMNSLTEAGYLIFEVRKMRISEKKTSMRRFYTATNKIFVAKKFVESKEVKVFRPNLYYGNGKFFNPWEPKLPEGTLREVSLFNDKDADYFHAPLKKRGAISIGSTFSLYDGATL